MTTPDTAAVRAWARDNGYTLSDRGRLPAEITEAYAAAHPAGTAAAKKTAPAKNAPAKKAPAKTAPAKKAPAKKSAAKKAPARKSAAKKAPAPKAPVGKPAVETVAPAADAAPTSQPPGSAPVTDPEKQQSGAPEDRRLIALAEQISALADRVTALEKAQSGNGKPTRFGLRKAR